VSTTAQELLDAGLAAIMSGEIDAAKESLTSAADASDLPMAHMVLGALAFADEDFPECQRRWEEAFRLFKESGNQRGAALAATNLGSLHYDALGNEAASRGWLSRANRLLDREGRCVERGYLELALVACSVRDVSALEESAAVALDLAIEFNDPSLEARALADGGLALISQGMLAKGFARLDEAMAPVSAGEVDPMMSGMIYCALLTACERTGELRRAEEWTRAAREFSTRRFAGKLPVLHAHCRLAYGTVLCDSGRLSEAEAELISAMDPDVSACVPKHAVAAGYLANLRLLQGRVDEAAELLAPFLDRFEVCEPLARLHYARGELDLAAAVIGRALHDMVGDRLRAGRMLRLLVDVELAGGDVDTADRTAERLADYADQSDSAVLRAEARLADGRVFVARGDWSAAVTALRAGLEALGAEERPILSAAIRLELAHALAEAGERAAASDEARGAHAALERLGVEREVRRAAALIEQLGTAPAAQA
jgi:tetratricopeptide (TPR) repeat protein